MKRNESGIPIRANHVDLNGRKIYIEFQSSNPPMKAPMMFFTLGCGHELSLTIAVIKRRNR